MSHSRIPKATESRSATVLEAIPNIGQSLAQDLRLLGIKRPAELIGRDPLRLYQALCVRTRSRQDPCVLDAFISAVRFMEGAPPRPWWHYTPERKKRLTPPPSQPNQESRGESEAIAPRSATRKLETERRTRFSRRMNKTILLGLLAAFALSGAAFAGSKTYQVTGPVVDVNDKMITVMKGKDKWEIDRDAATKVHGDVKVGDKVTINYTMTAKDVEVKADTAAKKEEKPAASPTASPKK